MIRYLQKQIEQDLQEKMVFVGGPRQVGKTTLAKAILGTNEGYLNWDIPEQRSQILKRNIPLTPLVVFDEIHKNRQWRNYLKGLYDERHESLQILVTGSARLDFYRFGGDSLQGRYHYLRLHPLSVAELAIQEEKGFMDLLSLGGFPEPFFSGSLEKARRWSHEYRSRLIQEDIMSLEYIHDVGNLELLMLRLPDLVGSPLSLNALREDLQVSHGTVNKWLKILERLYGIFRLSPFGAPKIRAVKKEQKHYHFDWSLVPDQSKRFENMVASHLLKWVHFVDDTEGRDIELRYFRDVDGREVDFVIMEDGKPVRFIECKWSDGGIDPSLRYLKERFPEAEAWQIYAVGTKKYRSRGGVSVTSAIDFLGELV